MCRQIKIFLGKILYQLFYIYLALFSNLLLVTPDLKAETSSEVQQPKRLTGNWNGLRTTLLNNGICLNAVYAGEIIKNIRGGIRNKSDYLDVVDLICDVDLENLVQWKNAHLYADIIGIHGGNPSHVVGDFQGVSNIAAPNTWKVYEIWLQQNFIDEKLSVLCGGYDLNSRFDVIETAGLFINSSHGMGAEFAQSGKNGPSTFPSTALAFRIKALLNKQISIQAAVLDGVPDECNRTLGLKNVLNKHDGALLTSEITFIKNTIDSEYLRWHSKRKQIHRQRRGLGKSFKKFRRSNHYSRKNQRSGHYRKHFHRFSTPTIARTYRKLAIGGWYYTADFNDLNYSESQPCLQRHGNWGMYALWEKSVFLNTENPQQSISYFLRFGISDKNVNQIDKYFGSGIVYSGIFSDDVEHDQIGFAVAAAHDVNHANNRTDHQPDNWEIAFELSYRAAIHDWFSIQPDVQYIVNPGVNPDLKNALCTGLRMEVCF